MKNASNKEELPKRNWWRRWLRAVALLFVPYVAGYFVLMDRHRPTSPHRSANDYFESSYRWAAKMRHSKDGSGPESPFPDVTIWNVIYRPLDRAYFKLFSRSDDEIEKLRALGYFQ